MVNDIDRLKDLCDSAETLQEKIRRFPDETELLAAVRAAGVPDPAGFLSYIRSAAVERQPGYILVPVRSELFHSSGERFMGYLTLWARELNRRGDEMYQQYSSDDEKLTRDTARFLASLECMHAITHDSMRIEELLGIPLLQSSGNHGDVDRIAKVSLVARLADIRLNGTFTDRLIAETQRVSDAEDGAGQEAGPKTLDAAESPELWTDRIEVDGQRFYPDIEAQELGAALCLAELIAWGE